MGQRNRHPRPRHHHRNHKLPCGQRGGTTFYNGVWACEALACGVYEVSQVSLEYEVSQVSLEYEGSQVSAGVSYQKLFVLFLLPPEHVHAHAEEQEQGLTVYEGSQVSAGVSYQKLFVLLLLPPEHAHAHAEEQELAEAHSSEEQEQAEVHSSEEQGLAEEQHVPHPHLHLCRDGALFVHFRMQLRWPGARAGSPQCFHPSQY